MTFTFGTAIRSNMHNRFLSTPPPRRDGSTHQTLTHTHKHAHKLEHTQNTYILFHSIFVKSETWLSSHKIFKLEVY